MRGVKSRLTLFVAGGVLAFLGLQVFNWYHPPKRAIAYRVTQNRPYEATRSRLETRIPGVTTEVVPKEIVVLKPTERAKAKIEKKLDGKLPVGPILGIREIKDLPHGGRAVISLEPDASSGGDRAVLTIYPRKPTFFEWTLDRSLGVWGGYGLGGQVWNLEFEQHLFRVGPAELSARAGVLASPLDTDAYVMVGASIRF